MGNTCEACGRRLDNPKRRLPGHCDSVCYAAANTLSKWGLLFWRQHSGEMQGVRYPGSHELA